MFSLPRDTVDVPDPARPGPAGVRLGLRGKINALVHARSASARTSTRAPGQTRGYNGLKAIMGNLYGLDIKYFVEVNFDGFTKRRRRRWAG